VCSWDPLSVIWPTEQDMIEFRDLNRPTLSFGLLGYVYEKAWHKEG